MQDVATKPFKRDYPLLLPYNSHPPLAITTNKPMSDLEHADRLMQEVGVLFSDKKSIMRSDYIELVEDRMLW